MPSMCNRTMSRHVGGLMDAHSRPREIRNSRNTATIDRLTDAASAFMSRPYGVTRTKQKTYLKIARNARYCCDRSNKDRSSNESKRGYIRNAHRPPPNHPLRPPNPLSKPTLAAQTHNPQPENPLNAPKSTAPYPPEYPPHCTPADKYDRPGNAADWPARPRTSAASRRPS